MAKLTSKARNKLPLTSFGIKPSHKGLLHKKLGVPQDKPIPAKKLAAAKDSKSLALRKEANFAINAKKFNHKGK